MEVGESVTGDTELERGDLSREWTKTTGTKTGEEKPTSAAASDSRNSRTTQGLKRPQKDPRNECWGAVASGDCGLVQSQAKSAAKSAGQERRASQPFG